MKKITAVAIAICIVLFCTSIAAAKIVGNFSSDSTGLKMVSLEEAKVKDNSTSANQTKINSESIKSDDYVKNEVAAGNTLFVRSLVDGIYSDFQKSAVKDQYGISTGALFTAITFVPNPYKDAEIIKLYGGYLNLAILMIVIFVLGEFMNRSSIRTGLYGDSDMSHGRFVGGIALCAFAVAGNIIYAGILELIQTLNQFIMMPVLPEISVNPDNIVLYVMMGFCDLLVWLFFIVRYFVIYIVAVLISVLMVLYAVEATRDFASNCFDKIIRILFLQPAAIFAASIGIIAIKNIPEGLQGYAYVGLTLVVFLVCWYFLFGSFKLLKTAVVFAIRKGVTMA